MVKKFMWKCPECNTRTFYNLHHNSRRCRHCNTRMDSDLNMTINIRQPFPPKEKRTMNILPELNNCVNCTLCNKDTKDICTYTTPASTILFPGAPCIQFNLDLKAALNFLQYDNLDSCGNCKYCDDGICGLISSHIPATGKCSKWETDKED